MACRTSLCKINMHYHALAKYLFTYFPPTPFGSGIRSAIRFITWLGMPLDGRQSNRGNTHPIATPSRKEASALTANSKQFNAYMANEEREIAFSVKRGANLARMLARSRPLLELTSKSHFSPRYHLHFVSSPWIIRPIVHAVLPRMPGRISPHYLEIYTRHAHFSCLAGRSDSKGRPHNIAMPNEYPNAKS